MNIFFNEKCLTDCQDVEKTLFFLNENLNILKQAKVRIYTNYNEFQNWINDWDSYFDATSRNYITQLLYQIESCNENKENYYYHYFQHQDYNLSISENISTSSIAIATNKVLSGNNATILNMPETIYNQRPFLPILKSPYDNKLKDELANIPCFDNAKKIIQYILLHEKIKPLINDDVEFEKFKKDYLKFIDKFDFSTWKPKTFSKNKELNLKVAFPAINYEVIKNNLLKWKIKQESFEDNEASYKKLGRIILELHGYTKNIQFARHYRHDIYEAGYGNSKLLISIDTENGAFELIENDGTHFGEYGNDGVYRPNTNIEAINSHSLIDIPKHMFIFK